MSRTDLRRLLLIGAAAFGLRAACALVNEVKPLFPSFYYTDAIVTDTAAESALNTWRFGSTPTIVGRLGERLQIWGTLATYAVFGPHPLAVNLVNAALGACGACALALALGRVFTPAIAALSAVLFALWPSNIFYESQNLKEAPTHLLAFAAMATALKLAWEPSTETSPARGAVEGTLVFALLLLSGFYRSYVMLVLVAALLAGFALGAAKGRRGSRVAAAASAVILAAALFRPASNGLFAFLQTKNELASLNLGDDLRNRPHLLPITYGNAEDHGVYSPTSPAGIARFRDSRQSADQKWAATFGRREIASQIFPGARFDTWFDVLAFMPKSAFYVLFMPLPGLYPLEGKLGRIMAATENLILLALAVLGLIGAARGPKTPERAVPLLFFFAMAAGSSLLEFDLGSAGRHKLLYLPMLFPFAAEEVLRLLGRKESV